MSGLSFGVESNALFIILDRDTAVYIYIYIVIHPRHAGIIFTCGTAVHLL